MICNPNAYHVILLFLKKEIVIYEDKRCQGMYFVVNKFEIIADKIPSKLLSIRIREKGSPVKNSAFNRPQRN